MGSQLPALEKLFDEWSKKHKEKLSTSAPYYLPEQEEPYGGFVRDGIINLESWKTQKVRICFILNEAGGRNGMEHYPDNFDLAAEWNERGSFSKFMFKLSVWTKAIQDAMSPNPTTYKKADVVKIRDELIRSIAVVNIKKSDGQRHTNFDLLQHFACEDADEIRRELEILRPNIIICSENMKFLREPLIPKPPKNKTAEGEEGTDTTVTAETATVETATPETVAAEIATPENPDKPSIPLPENLKYVFSTQDLQYVSKFAYLWGNTLVFSLWTPANFFGTISSNTINYYAIREIVRAALKAFSEKQRRKKVQQTIEENTKKKAERKAQHQAELAAKKAQKTGEAPAPAPKVEAAPQPAAPAPTPSPAPQLEPTPAPAVEETKPKTRRTTKKAAEDATENAEDAPKKTAKRTTKKAAEDTATTEDAPKKTTRRTKKVTTEE